MAQVVSNIATDIKYLRETDFKYLKDDVTEIKEKLGKDYVTQDQLNLTKAELARLAKIVYFACAILAGTFFTAVANFFLKKP